MKKQYVSCICCCIIIAAAGCAHDDRQTSDGVKGNLTQQETTSANSYAGIMDEELKELSQYQGIEDTFGLGGFYNLDFDEKGSGYSHVMAQSFLSTGNFQYCYTEDGVIFLGYVVLKDGIYYELLYNTSDGSSIINPYGTMRTEETEEMGTDNIRRRQTLFFLENGEVSKYIGKDVRNITNSEVVDALKQYKGNVDQSAYAVWGTPDEIFNRYYSPEHGLMLDFKYATKADDTLYLCGLNLAPEGYCLTVYDPVKDWFEVWDFSDIYCVQASDGTNEYYLSNLTEEYDYMKNTVQDIESDGYLYISN